MRYSRRLGCTEIFGLPKTGQEKIWMHVQLCIVCTSIPCMHASVHAVHARCKAHKNRTVTVHARASTDAPCASRHRARKGSIESCTRARTTSKPAAICIPFSLPNSWEAQIERVVRRRAEIATRRVAHAHEVA